MEIWQGTADGPACVSGLERSLEIFLCVYGLINPQGQQHRDRPPEPLSRPPRRNAAPTGTAPSPRHA